MAKATNAASKSAGPALRDSYLLVLNTAEGRLQMLVARQNTEQDMPVLCYAGQWALPSQGAELLAPALRDACQRLRISVSDIKRIAVVRGPGSFTGIRLALATASGLARATGAALGGMDYLPLLADSARALMEPVFGQATRLFALTHARRDLVHMQGFSCAGASGLIPLSGVMVLSPQEASSCIQSLCGPPELLTQSSEHDLTAEANIFPGAGKQGPGPESGSTFLAAPLAASFPDSDLAMASITAPSAVPGCQVRPKALIFGSGVSKNRAALDSALHLSSCFETLLLPDSFDHPSPEALLKSASSIPYGPDDVAPLYARPSDAEENLKRIAEGLGLDPIQAELRLAELTGRSS